MFRVIKESEAVDGRQHCFMLQSSPPDAAPRYLSVDTRQELIRIETSWNSSIITSVIKLGVSEHLTYSNATQCTIHQMCKRLLICSAKYSRCRIKERAVRSHWIGKLDLHCVKPSLNHLMCSGIINSRSCVARVMMANQNWNFISTTMRPDRLTPRHVIFSPSNISYTKQ